MGEIEGGEWGILPSQISEAVTRGQQVWWWWGEYFKNCQKIVNTVK